MDIEQLKLILEAAAAAGDGAVKVVYVWFAYKFAGLLVPLGAIYAVYRVIDAIRRGIQFAQKVQGVVGRIDTESYNQESNFIEWLTRQHEREPFSRHTAWRNKGNET